MLVETAGSGTRATASPPVCATAMRSECSGPVASGSTRISPAASGRPARSPPRRPPTRRGPRPPASAVPRPGPAAAPAPPPAAGPRSRRAPPRSAPAPAPPGQPPPHRAGGVPPVPLDGDQLGDAVQQVEPLLGPVPGVRLHHQKPVRQHRLAHVPPGPGRLRRAARGARRRGVPGAAHREQAVRGPAQRHPVRRAPARAGGGQVLRRQLPAHLGGERGPGVLRTGHRTPGRRQHPGTQVQVGAEQVEDHVGPTAAGPDVIIRRCRSTTAARSPARSPETCRTTCSVMVAKATDSCTANSGSRCRAHATTRSSGTLPSSASPAARAATPACTRMRTKGSESAASRRQARPDRTSSPPDR